jgi:uncharacterized protein
MAVARARQRIATWVAVAWLLALPLPAKDVPFLTGRVNDVAGIIPADVRTRVEARLAEVEKETGAQIAVLTIDSLEGEPLEDYALRVAQTWRLGRKGVDDGVLLLIARNDRKMRIEVGYGLEAKLTDAQSRRILDDVVRPRFRDGDFGGGVEAGVNAIIGTIQGKDVIAASAPPRRHGPGPLPLPVRLFGSLIFVIVIGVFSTVALFTKGCSGWFLYLFLIPFYAGFPVVLWGLPGAVVIPLWVIGFPVLKLLLGRTPMGKNFVAAHPGLIAFATSGGHSGSGGGWSGGGFSGGGGSFGGGGASSGW